MDVAATLSRRRHSRTAKPRHAAAMDVTAALSHRRRSRTSKPRHAAAMDVAALARRRRTARPRHTAAMDVTAASTRSHVHLRREKDGVASAFHLTHYERRRHEEEQRRPQEGDRAANAQQVPGDPARSPEPF